MDNLKIIQQLLLNIMIEIDRICRNHNIEYSISSGTLLGAIRHKGFIPWDDDIDIMMSYDNYKYFLEVAQKELPQQYVLDCIESRKDSPYLYAKIVDKNTTYINVNDKYINASKGVSLDIFPVFGFPKEKLKNISKKSCIYNSLFYIKLFNGEDANTVKKIIKKIINSLVSINFIVRYYFKTMTRYNNINNEVAKADFISDNKYFDYSIFNEYQDIEFEGYMFRAIKRYDEYLTIAYGDYMKLPPVEEQAPHHDYLYFNANKPYKEYLAEQEKNNLLK